jgi:hypothetical protein
MEIAAPTRALQGFLRFTLQGSFHEIWGGRQPLSHRHHPTKTARAKGGRTENCAKSHHRDVLAQFTRLLSL